MYTSILLIIINVIANLVIRINKKYENEYIKEKHIFYKLKTKILFRIINVSYLIINCINYGLLIMANKSISVVELVLSSIVILTYILLELYRPKKVKLELYEDKYINIKDILLVLSCIVIMTADKTKLIHINSYDNDLLDIASIVYFILSYLLIIGSLVILIVFLFKNKKIVKQSITSEEYIEDIHYSSKIQLNRITNYLIYIFAYLVFIFIQIPYVYIFYILVFFVLLYVIYKKYLKIKTQNDKLYKAVSIAKQDPGVIYAFQFTRDILLFKNLIILIIIYAISITSLYGLGESAFAIISIELYIYLLYNILENKKYLIRYISSLNDSFIDEEIYNLKLNKKISYVDIISILDINLYRIIVIDNMIYKSNLILYDPELKIDNIDIITRKDNLEDYITLEYNLYEE